MAKFKPGERARIKAGVDCDMGLESVRGKECTIVEVSPEGWRPRLMASLRKQIVYSILPDGYIGPRTFILESGLEKRTGSWDDIERVTGWRPSMTRTPEKAPEREPETVT